MLRRRIWIQALLGGALAGGLVEVLVIRLNPATGLEVWPVLLGWLVWMSWGAVVVGVPLALLRVLSRRLRRRTPRTVSWRMPEIFAATYLTAAVLTRVNADLHTVFLAGSAHRLLGQDAVAWLVACLLAFAAGSWVGQRGGPRWRLAFVVCFLILPLVRPLAQPAPPAEPVEAAAEPLGCPSRPLLVLGIEGLDSRVLLAHAAGDRYPRLAELTAIGSWGSLEPHRPFLRQSLWTTTATGTSPRHHGMRSRWVWQLPGFLPGPFALVPWTPLGSRWMLPWGLAERRLPPIPSVPPLWQRLAASNVDTVVVGWPGRWPEGTLTHVSGNGGDELALGTDTRHRSDQGSARSPDLDSGLMEPAFRDALETALEPFPEARDDVLGALETDVATCHEATTAISAGARNVWVHLVGLASVRTDFEPLRPRDVIERRILELGLEQLDELVGTLRDAMGPEALVAVVSPYGMEPPDSFERLLRLFGAGGTWRASAQTCPDGVLVLSGDGIAAGRRDSLARLTDLAPTLCYLLGLPVAQYMEGRVMLDAIDPAFVAGQPLRVVS